MCIRDRSWCRIHPEMSDRFENRKPGYLSGWSQEYSRAWAPALQKNRQPRSDPHRHGLQQCGWFSLSPPLNTIYANLTGKYTPLVDMNMLWTIDGAVFDCPLQVLLQWYSSEKCNLSETKEDLSHSAVCEMQVKSPSKDLIVRDLPHKICCSGYPQGEKERPISTIEFVSNATTIFPYNHAFALSGSVFGRCPRPNIDFNRLKANSTCHLIRYNDKISTADNTFLLTDVMTNM